MRRQLCVELFSKITIKNGCSITFATLVSPNSPAFPKSSSNPFHQLYFSHYSTLSRCHIWKMYTPNAVSGTMPNMVFPSSVFARRFFSNALFKGKRKFPVTFRNTVFLRSFRSLDRGRLDALWNERLWHNSGMRGLYNLPVRVLRRSVFRRFTTEGVVLGLIMTNVAVFILWKIADPGFMIKNFMVMVATFKRGWVHTLITSAFSDIDPFHLLGNMIGLYFFGTSIGHIFGPGYLLKLYLTGGIAGSVFHLAYYFFLAPSHQGQQVKGMGSLVTPGLTASGALNAIMLLDIFICPTPVPAILLGILIVSQDVRMALKGDFVVSVPIHLGGATVAALTWLQTRRGRIRRF